MKNGKETLDLYSFEVHLSSNKHITEEHISPYLDMLFDEDSLRIKVTIDGIENKSFQIEEKSDIRKVLEMNQHIDEDSETIIKYEIVKLSKGFLKIYNLEKFLKYLHSLSLYNTLTIFSTNYSIHEYVPVLINLKEEYTFETNLFTTNFTHRSPVTNKEEKVEMWKFSSNTQNIGSFGFVPEDFKVLNYSSNLQKLFAFFNDIAILLSIAYISNTSNINNNIFRFQIIGYKKIDYRIDFLHTKLLDVNVFFKIYEWIYSAGNGSINDKIGLARNIISRHIEVKNSVDIIILHEDAFSSILTAYNIYLKENVEKYIETKNKVAEVSTEISVKSKDISNYILSSFKNNNLTILSYFISIFVFNSLAFDSKAVIFTLEKYYITMAVLLISALYLVITLRQTQKEIYSNIRYFYSMKKIYKDIFDNKELSALFSKRLLKYNNRHVRKTVNRYAWLWVLEIILLFSISIYLTFFL